MLNLVVEFHNWLQSYQAMTIPHHQWALSIDPVNFLEVNQTTAQQRISVQQQKRMKRTKHSTPYRSLLVKSGIENILFHCQTTQRIEGGQRMNVAMGLRESQQWEDNERETFTKDSAPLHVISMTALGERETISSQLGEECWLVDWLVGWLVDWLVGWLVDWLVGWLIDWLIDLIVVCCRRSGPYHWGLGLYLNLGKEPYIPSLIEA